VLLPRHRRVVPDSARDNRRSSEVGGTTRPKSSRQKMALVADDRSRLPAIGSGGSKTVTAGRLITGKAAHSAYGCSHSRLRTSDGGSVRGEASGARCTVDRALAFAHAARNCALRARSSSSRSSPTQSVSVELRDRRAARARDPLSRERLLPRQSPPFIPLGLWFPSGASDEVPGRDRLPEALG